MIDTTFDTRSDAGRGDPDTRSKTLREYHRLLWSKALPNGKVLELDTSSRSRYLHHESELGRFTLSSDTVVPTFRRYRRAQAVIEQIPESELDHFQYVNHTVGGAMVFPGNRIPGVGRTINGARGMNPKISDRFDLTLEAIRRHYLGGDSPIEATLAAYGDFFRLFESFDGYVDFFLLGDLVDSAGEVKLFTPWDGFGSPAVPATVDAYRSYRDHAVAFLEARNRRIDAWARANLPRE